uniref:Uncharacterized protein n=1 Tax=Aegilops tauschii subsp. strangulata TaxID=200361 RepID=A0A453IAU1_AEGTS
KSVFGSAPYAMKQAALGAGVAARKNGTPLSMAAVVFSLFVFATFLYNEDIKSIADFPFGAGAGALRAKSPDLHLLQEAEAAAHQAVTTLAMRGEEAIVRVLDAPRHRDRGGGGQGQRRLQRQRQHGRRQCRQGGGGAGEGQGRDAPERDGRRRRGGGEAAGGRGGGRAGVDGEGRGGDGGGAADGGGERAGDVRPVPRQLGVRRGERAGVQGDALRVPDGAGDLHAQRPPRRLVSEVAVAADRLRPPPVRRSSAAGAAAQQAADVRGGFAEPEPVGVDGVPGPVGDPQGPQDPHQVRQQRIQQRLLRPRLQRDGGVLLGALPGGVQLGQPQGAQRPGPRHTVALHRQARQELGQRRLPRLQHLHLVAQRARHESPKRVVRRGGYRVRGGGPARGVQRGAQDVGQVGRPQH